MIFSELYGSYYNVVAKILKAALDHPVTEEEMRGVVRAYAFSESVLAIVPALREERWQLLDERGKTPLEHMPEMPLTLLQKRWLQAIRLDPRIRLFGGQIEDFGVEPLFTPDDVYVFDKYADGDPYQDENYIRNFRVILDAIGRKIPLKIDVLNRKGEPLRVNVFPERLEYSEKDDKFRLISSHCRYGNILNLARIVSVKTCQGQTISAEGKGRPRSKRRVALELFDERNALERVVLHFAHFEKETRRLGDTRYRLEILYDAEDETEIVIRVLSFGPLVKVVAPQSFAALITERLKMQKSFGLF